MDAMWYLGKRLVVGGFILFYITYFTGLVFGSILSIEAYIFVTLYFVQYFLSKYTPIPEPKSTGIRWIISGNKMRILDSRERRRLR